MNDAMNRAAQAVANLYTLFTGALNGLLSNALNDSDVLMPKTAAKLSAGLYAASDAFLRGAVDALDAAPAQMVAAALIELQQTGQEQPEAVLESLAVLTGDEVNKCLQVLTELAGRDVRAARASYQRFVQQVAILTAARRRSTTQAVIAVRLKTLPLPDKTGVRDAAGRMWAGEKYVYTTVRALLVKLYSQSFVTMAAALKHDLVYARHPEPAKSFVFSIAGAGAEHPGYLDIQHDTFHPNSRYALELH